LKQLTKAIELSSALTQYQNETAGGPIDKKRLTSLDDKFAKLNAPSNKELIDTLREKMRNHARVADISTNFAAHAVNFPPDLAPTLHARRVTAEDEFWKAESLKECSRCLNELSSLDVIGTLQHRFKASMKTARAALQPSELKETTTTWLQLDASLKAARVSFWTARMKKLKKHWAD
jgi:hypothetical protein